MLCIGIIDQQPVALDRGPAVSYSIGGHVTAEISIPRQQTARSPSPSHGLVIRGAGHEVLPPLCSRLSA